VFVKYRVMTISGQRVCERDELSHDGCDGNFRSLAAKCKTTGSFETAGPASEAYFRVPLRGAGPEVPIRAPAVPVHFEHWCDHPGCMKWGSFGRELRGGIIEWRCGEHLAADYWEGRSTPRN
jgi:hypothetical protein